MAYSPSADIALSAFGAPTANINMNNHKFTSLLDGSAAGDTAGWDQLTYTGTQYAYVASGCVWSVVSGLNGTMTSGTVVVAGLTYSVASIASHAFTAGDVYVDINIQSGAAVVNFTSVPNYTQSPALVSSGTQFNTVRIAVIIVAAASISSFIQGSPGSGSGLTQPASSVAAGSNGANITAGTLNTNAQTTAFPTGGGWAVVNHSSGPITYVIQFTGATSSTLTGVTVVSGSGTVATNDVITGCLPLGVTDSLGNIIYNTQPYPRVIGWAQFQNTITTTGTASVPLQVNNATSFTAPFIIPAGISRNVRIEVNLAFLGSSAAAGTLITLTGYSDNASTSFAVGTIKVAVASDGTAMFTTGVKQLAPGTYNAQCSYQQGAAGTMTAGATYLNSNIAVEYV
jgi:hypothetical protein